MPHSNSEGRSVGLFSIAEAVQTATVSWFMLLRHAACLHCTSHSGVACSYTDGISAATHLANSSSQQSSPSVH